MDYSESGFTLCSQYARTYGIGDHRQRVTHSLSAEHCYVCADRWNIEYYSRSCQLRFTDFKWNNLVTTLLTDLWVVCHTNRALFAIRLFWPNKWLHNEHFYKSRLAVPLSQCIEWTANRKACTRHHAFGITYEANKATRSTSTTKRKKQKIICIFLGHLVDNRKTKLLISEPLSNCHAWTRGDQRAKRQFNFLSCGGMAGSMCILLMLLSYFVHDTCGCRCRVTRTVCRSHRYTYM